MSCRVLGHFASEPVVGDGSGSQLVLDLLEAVAPQACSSVAVAEPGYLLATEFGLAVFRLVAGARRRCTP